MASKNKFKNFFKRKSSYIVFIACFILLSAVLFLIFQRLPIKYKSVTYYPQNINNSNAKIFFSDANNLYEVSLNQGRPKKIASVTRFISSIIPLNNGDVLINGGGRYVGKNGKLPPGWSYEDDGAVVYQASWILKKGISTPQVISVAESNRLNRQAFAAEKYFYTHELLSGEADIMLQKSDSSAPIKVGHLTDKIDTVSPCQSQSYQVHPKDFTSSFDGKYLLSLTTGGGGTCSATRHVITSDGKVKFKLERSYKSIVWIGTNKLLLSHDKDSKSEIITLNSDGTFKTKTLDLDLRNYSIDQKDISPSKRLIFLHSWGSGFLRTPNAPPAVYDIEKNTITSIKDPVSNGEWHKTSDIILLTYTTSKGTSDTSRITIYDPVTKKSYKIATFPISARDVNPVFILW